MSLRARLLIGMAMIATVLGVTALVVTRTTEAHLLHQVDVQLQGAQRPGRGFDLGPHRDDTNGGVGAAQISSVYVGLVSPSGQVTTSFAPNLTGSTPLPDIDGQRALRAAGTGEPFTVGSQGSDLRYRAQAHVDDRLGAVVVLALPLGDVDSAVHRLIGVEAIATISILAVLALVTWWVIRLGVRPVKAMAASAGRIAEGDLAHRVPEAAAGTEAAELGVALNRMLGRIEEAFAVRSRSEERLRRFAADASHELRTPVATIRGYAELYRTGGLEEPEMLNDAMRRTEQEATRMGGLIDDLLNLARLDQGRPLEVEPVDLTQLARDAVSDARAVDPARPLGVSADGPVTVMGDEGRLRQVLGNLVNNARVHTSPDTAVHIRVAAVDGRAVLEVSDDGQGMTPEVASRAFERFYRADPSRSRHSGGSGLGLAIVQATTEAHRGTVTLTSQPGAGTTVRVVLPLVTDF